MFAKNFRKLLVALNNTASEVVSLLFTMLGFLIALGLMVLAVKAIFYLVFNSF